MSGKFLLDTNIIIGIFANDDSIPTSLAEAEEVFVPIVALRELYYEAYRSRNQRQKIKLNQSLFLKSALNRTLTKTYKYGVRNERVA